VHSLNLFSTIPHLKRKKKKQKRNKEKKQITRKRVKENEKNNFSG